MPTPHHPPRSGEAGPWRGAGVWPLLAVLLLLLALYANSSSHGGATTVPYSTFLERVRDGQVSAVTIFDRRLVADWREPGQPADAKARQMAVERPSGLLEQDLIPLLTDHGVKFEAKPTSPLSSLLMLVVMTGGLVLLLSLVLRRANPAERAMAFGKSRARQYVERDTKTTFDDIAGIDEPKQELQEIVEYLRTPGKFRRLGGRIPKGVLLVGAPGTGKTLLAKAVAGEAKVPFFSMSGSDFVELYVGVGASRVRDLFRQAEQHSPCIVFIDELDALGKARGQSLLGGGHDEREQTLNQLLVEMDGFESGSNVILMAATNRPEILDAALLRPGRFDRQVMIPPPDVSGREAILRVHARQIRLDPEVDLRRVAQRTPGFVGADLANVVNEAALLAARLERESVTFADFDEAIDRVAVGLERRSHVISDEEKQITAVHEAGHAIVATFCEHADPVHKISIIPRGVTGGLTWFVPRDDRHLWTRLQLQDRLAALLGGRVAEELVFGDVSTGAAGDIRQVTEVARAMVVELGMSDNLGPINYETGAPRGDAWGLPTTPPRATSETTARQIDDEVRRLVETAYGRARQVLLERRAGLEALAARLLEIEVVDREEMLRILGVTPGPPTEEEPAVPG